MRAAALLALALWTGAAFAGDRVAGYALEVGERYYLEALSTEFLNVPGVRRLGVMTLPRGKLIKVYERREVDGEVWYYVKAIRYGTLNPNDHLWGWISAAELRTYGVAAY